MLPPWSYSFLRDFANCPHKAFRKYVKRDLPKEEMGAALTRGIETHEALESYINDGVPLPDELDPVRPIADALKAREAVAEEMLGMSEERGPAPFWDDPWGRGKLDVCVFSDGRGETTFIVDWKTGKVREDPRELLIQSMLVQANYPTVTTIKGCYVWLDPQPKIGVRYDLTNVERAYRGTVSTMTEANRHNEAGHWPKKSNPLCGWCPVLDCEHNKRGER